MKFQHFKGLSKFLHFYVCICKHTFFRILRPPYTKLPLKKSLFRVFIHSNTPGGYSPQRQMRKAKHATPDRARPNTPHTAPSRPQRQAVGAPCHLRALYAGVFACATPPYKQHRIGSPRRPPLQQRLAHSIVPQSCPQ